MKEYNRIKIQLRFFITFIILELIILNVLSIVLYSLNETLILSITLSVISFIVAVVGLKLFNNYFNKVRNKIIFETFKSFGNENLSFTKRKPVDYEILDGLGYGNLAVEFYISNVIDGEYNGVKILGYNADYTDNGKRKNAVDMRIYKFEFKKEIEKNYILSDFNSKILHDSALNKKLKIKDNIIYLSYANSARKTYYQFEPLAFKNYDLFKERIEDELILIKNVCEVISKDLK